MKLTKEQAIEEFRKQYRYIAEQYLKGRVDDLGVLKEEYLKKVGYIAKNDCYLCEYAEKKKTEEQKTNLYQVYMCDYCPINFVNNIDSILEAKTNTGVKLDITCMSTHSIYWELSSYCFKTPLYFRDNKYMAQLAIKIANLSERGGVK